MDQGESNHMSAMNVLLVDDHPLFLEGLKSLLTLRDINVVGTARDGVEALAQSRALRPDLVLMDVQMPNCDGLEALRLIKAEMPTIQVVMLTMSTDDQHLFEAIKSGAAGYVPKTLDAEGFYDLITGLSRGEVAIPRNLAAKIMAEFANRAQGGVDDLPHQTGPDALTARQIEVLQLVSQGKSNSEIAEVLFITERTVKYHMHEVLEKLHMRNRAQVIAYAVSSGLVKPLSDRDLAF